MKNPAHSYPLICLSALLLFLMAVLHVHASPQRRFHPLQASAGVPGERDEVIHTLFFPGAVITNINTIYLPFTLVGQLIVVQGRVDTLEGNFIFDTGAERLVLNAKHFANLVPGSAVSATGNTGLVAGVSRQSVDSLHLEQLVFLRQQAHLTDLSHLEYSKNTRFLGILGYQVYRDFELFIDFPNMRLVLSRVDRDGRHIDSLVRWELPLDSLDFTLKGHAIIVRTEVNGVRLPMMLDTGAELNLLDRRVRRKALDNFTILKRVNLKGAGQRDVEVLAGILGDVRVGDETCAEMNTLLTNLDILNEGLGISVYGVLGYEFLKYRRVMINYQKEKIYFFGLLKP